jgi:hypothetical protein
VAPAAVPVPGRRSLDAAAPLAAVTTSTTTWGSLFDRAAALALDLDEAAVRDALATRRADERGETGHERRAGGEDRRSGAGTDGSTGDGPEPSEPPEPSPARVVADADVLAADLLVGGPARDALDRLRAHSWTTLVASDALLADAEAVVAALAAPDPDLAADWRARVAGWRESVAHPSGDHPGLASAYRGGAMHLLSFDERLTSARAGAGIRGRVPLSVRRPDAFAAVFDADSLYRTVVGGPYPGPDRDARE